jgi:hypothetical protein
MLNMMSPAGTKLEVCSFLCDTDDTHTRQSVILWRDSVCDAEKAGYTIDLRVLTGQVKIPLFSFHW